MRSRNRVLPDKWVDSHGKIIRIKNMNSVHLQRAIRHLRSKGFEQEYLVDLGRPGLPSIQLEAMVDELQARGLEELI